MAVTILDKVTEGMSITGKAQEAISGGQFVKAMSVADVSTSTPDASLEFGLADAAGDIPAAVGIATSDAASGENVDISFQGIYRVNAAGAVEAGERVGTSADARAVANVAESSGIGIALSTAASGENLFIVLGQLR